MEALARLFGNPARLKLLRLFLFNDDSIFSATDAIFRTKTAKVTARKELALLLTAGVLKKRQGKVGGKSINGYSANKKFAYYEQLHIFLRDTTSVTDTAILTQLRKAGTLRMVALSGMFTGALEPKVDLLVVGDRLDERALGSAIHTLEAELGRELRFATFSTEDFKYRVGVYDRLVRDVFDYPHRTLLDRISAN